MTTEFTNCSRPSNIVISKLNYDDHNYCYCCITYTRNSRHISRDFLSSICSVSLLLPMVSGHFVAVNFTSIVIVIAFCVAFFILFHASLQYSSVKHLLISNIRFCTCSHNWWNGLHYLRALSKCLKKIIKYKVTFAFEN